VKERKEKRKYKQLFHKVVEQSVVKLNAMALKVRQESVFCVVMDPNKLALDFDLLLPTKNICFVNDKKIRERCEI
jgi:hypothetical protein